MTYAFQTTDKLCFILDLMNGGDLHYHLSQHGTFFENEIRFYACEVILGLEHMHTRGIVYRDLKVTCTRWPRNIKATIFIADVSTMLEINLYDFC